MSQISSTSGTGLSGTTLTAFFDHRHHAEDAVNRLVDAGVPRDNIRLVPGYEADQPVTERPEVHKGFFESLADFFLPDEDRYSYAEGLSRGGYLVTVTSLSGDRYDTALDILDDEGAVNLDEREQNWRSEGWSGYQGGSYSDTEPSSSYNDSSLSSGSATGATGSTYAGTSSGSYAGSSGLGATGTTRTSTLSAGGEEVIPVVEEELRIGKRDVNNGRVRVRSYVTETPVSEQVSLRDERVSIERRPVDRPLTGTEAAFQDREIEAEEHSEQAVVAKEARVTEEIALRKQSDVRQETVSDTVRKTEVEVEDERDTAARGTGTTGSSTTGGSTGGTGGFNRR